MIQKEGPRGFLVEKTLKNRPNATTSLSNGFGVVMVGVRCREKKFKVPSIGLGLHLFI